MTALDLDAAVAIRALLLQHKVIFFPEQHLEPAQHLAFARAFGTPTPAHPVIPGIEGFPEIFQIDYQAGRGKYVDTAERTNDGLSWHSDVTYVERPPMGSILNAVVMPAAGGDTQWTNQQAAYETLSESLREYLGTLTARHSGKKQFGALLAFLYAHSTRPENVVRHHWHQGDLAFWDNRATQHSVVGDYGSQPRVIQRITLEGDQPV